VCLLLTGTWLNAAQLQEIRVTQVVNDVNLASAAVPRRVAVGERLRDGDAINTGITGRSELTFANQTIARLGAKTNISVSDETRTIDLAEGAVLFQIPEGAGRLKLKTAAIALVSTGATGIIERHGEFLRQGACVRRDCPMLSNTSPGRIAVTPARSNSHYLSPDVTALPEPADFDIAREMNTCLLVRDFQPLASQRRIETEEQKQLKLIAKGTYIPSNLVILGRGTQVTLVNGPSATPPPKALTNTGQKSHTP
jgi:hypothetical protein